MTVKLNIPAGNLCALQLTGVSESVVLSVPGRGNVVGGRTGDLNVTFKVDAALFSQISRHDVFERKENDIYIEHRIPLHIALLGGAVVVATIREAVEIKLPAGIQNDEVKRLSHRGIQPANGTPGNQYIRFKVDIPRYQGGAVLRLSEKQRSLIEECFDVRQQAGPNKESYFTRLRKLFSPSPP